MRPSHRCHLQFIFRVLFVVGVGGQVDAKACIAALPDCEPRVLEHCLRTYSVPAENGEDDNCDGVASEVGGARWRTHFIVAHLNLARRCLYAINKP